MEKKKMTVAEALSKLKLLDKRIRKAVKTSGFVGYSIGEKIQGNFKKDEAKSSFDSISDLIDYRFKLKSAINKSNFETKVKISNKEMTVLQAIELKSSIEYDKMFLDSLKRNYAQVLNIIEDGNEEVKERLDVQVRSAFEKASKKDIEQFSETFLKNNRYDIVDPLNIDGAIKDLDAQIDNFESEVDFVLSTSNATTIIKL